MKSIVVFVISSFFFNACYAQDQIDYSKFGGVKVKSQVSHRLNTPYFKRYGNPVFEEYVKVTPYNSERFIGGPEEILFKVYTANSDKQLQSYFLKGTKTDQRSYKVPGGLATDTSRNFLLLRHKLTWDANNQTLSFIKYTQYIDSVATKDFLIQVVADKKGWKGAEIKAYNDIAFVLQSVSAEEFWSLHKRGSLEKTDAPIAKEILMSVKDEDGTLNLAKLEYVIREKFKQGKKNLTDQ